MKALGYAALIIGVIYGLYGLAYLVARWELSWFAERGPGALSRSLSALAYAAFLIIVAIPIASSGHDSISSPTTIIGALFLVAGIALNFTTWDLASAKRPAAAAPASAAAATPAPPAASAPPAQDGTGTGAGAPPPSSQT